MSCTNIRCYSEHGRCYTLDLSQVDPGQPDTKEMITISDPPSGTTLPLQRAAVLESRADQGPGIPWDQIEAEA